MSHIKNLFFDELSRALEPRTTRPWPAPRPRPTPHRANVATVWSHDVELECHFEYEPEIRGARDNRTGVQLEPDYAATLTLVGAYVGAVDIMPLLSVEVIDEIERELMP